MEENLGKKKVGNSHTAREEQTDAKIKATFGEMIIHTAWAAAYVPLHFMLEL